jgi:hypothetical protein
MFGSSTTDKLFGKSEEERFRAWQDREVMREQERQSLEANPDRAAYLLSQNPLIQGYVEYEAKKMGLSPEEVEKVKQDYIQTMLDQGLTKDQINQNISALGEFVSPVSIPGAGRVGKITNEYVGKALSKVAAPVSKVIGNLPARAIEKTAGGIELGANKVLQGTEFVQTVSKKIGEYAINDPDTWIKGTANTAVLPVVAVAKPTKSVARVVKDIARQVDVGGTAGRRGMLERAGGDALSSDLTQRLFGPQGKGGVARAKIGDWVIRQSNAIVQPGVHAAAMNVVMGLPDIETAEDLGFSAGTGFGIGGLSGTRAIERAETLVDPRKTMAEKITEIVTPDPTAYRRDEDADIKRFMAQASPEIQQNIADLSDIQKRKAAVDATIASLEKERDAQINPDDAAFRQKQIDGFLKQKEALSKATPETQAEATRQTALAFIDAYDLAQSTGGVAGLRGVNIAVLDPANADQFFRDLYGDSLKQAETTVNLLTGIPSLTETDSTKLTEARQLLQRFQTDVEGAKSARGFALQEDNTDPNSAGFVPPHLRRINQQGATAVINADLVKQLSLQGFNIRHTLQHEVQHAVQQFAEVNKMLAPIRGQLFDQKIKNDDGSVEVYQQGYYSDEDLDRYATQYAKMMSPSDNGASFYAQFGGEVEKMRAYIKDEILAETAAATGEYAGGTRASLDDVGRNVMDWFEVKTKSGRLKQLKETLRKGGIIFDNAGEYSSVLGAKISPETLAMMRQYQRGLKDFDGTMTIQQSRESDEPDIPLTKVLGSVALQNKYRHADFFEKEQIIKATAPDGSVTEIVVPAGAKIDPFIDVYRTQNGQLVDANGNVVTLGPEITFGSMPDGTTFETDTRIARKSNGSPIILTNREMKSRARERTKIIQTAIDSAKNDGSGVRLADTGNGNYRGVMSPAQIEAFMALPNEVVSPNLKRMTKFFNELMARNDGTRVVMEYQAALLNGKYKALSPKIRDEVPIGFQIAQDGNFALTTISVSRLYDKMQAWADKKPENLQPWNGDTGAFWDSLIKLLDNHSRGEKGETGLHPDAYIAGKMKNKINDLFNAYNAETKQSNPDRSTLPRARGKDNLDIVIRSRRLDRINNFSESPSQKLPINYGYLTTNYMPAVNPMAAPMTAEEVQNRFDGSVTATRVRKAMATGEVDALESELRQMDDLLPTESLQLVQGEDQMPRIQIVSMFDPENVASLEPEEIVSDIDAETEAELAILDAQDGTVPPQDIAKVLSAKLDQLYADGGRSPIIPALETELEKIYQQLESQAQEQAAATEDVIEAPETTEVDMMNSPQDLIAQAVDNYNSGKVDNETQTLPEYIRSVVNEAGALQISPDVTDEQIVAAANDVMQYRQSLKDRIQSGTRFENAVVAPAGLQYLPAFHASRADFDKFNLDFIDSGNREQVYGWGLYFAENRKEIDKFVPLQYQYKVDIDIDENNLLDWGASLDPRLNDAAEKLKNEIELETLSGVRIYTNQDYYEALSEYLGDPKNASMQLKAMGFDGIKYTDRITQSKQKQIGLTAEQIASIPTTFNYVIFDDSKIKILDKGDKSLGPITQFMPAGAAEAPSGERGFQSKLQMEIQRNFKGARATPEQLKAVITNPQNVKQEEVKWSGVLDAIDRIAGENNGKVPVAELMDYLRNEGQVKFEEVTLGKDRSVEDIADTYRIKIEDQYGEAAFYDEFDDPLEFDELPFALQNAIDKASKLPEPRFAKYQLPGGENYREVVMTVPRKTPQPTDAEVKEYYGLLPRKEELTGDELNRYNELLGKIDASNKEVQNNVYYSSHFPNVPNYVAHMRLNERTDAEGNDGLFIEELQSDRHQAGREKGYKEDVIPLSKEEADRKEAIKNKLFELEDQGIDEDNPTPEYQALNREFINLAIRDQGGRISSVPDAPFRKDWSLQLFKRALRDAVESGKQWIGWTTGIEQVKRYEEAMRQTVDEITWGKPKGDQIRTFAAFKNGGITNIVNSNGEILSTYDQSDPVKRRELAQKWIEFNKSTYPDARLEEANRTTVLSGKIKDDGTVYDSSVAKANGEQLSEVVGKEIAAKILSEDSGTVAGNDLTVGGEGMKGFYDTILPKEIGKYVAKMGGKVEKSEIATTKPDKEIDDFTDAELLQELARKGDTTPIWKVNITPEMANIVSAGQLQFMPAVQTIPERFTGTGEKGEERRGRYVAPPEFWTRFDIGEFEQGGKFFDIETGEDITNKTYGTGTIDVTGKRPSLVSDSIIDEMPDEKGRTWKTNLFRKSAGWEWISENPPEVATIGSKQKPNPVLISVENNPDHFYSLKVDFPNGVKLARYPKSGEPRLRPTKKGEIQFGNEVGRIRTSKGKEHPVYDTITIGQPQFMPAGESDTEYINLAQDPEANQERLQKMVDEAARKVGGIDVWHKSRGKSYVPKTGNPRYEQSTDDWTVFDPEKATYGVFYASTDKQAVDKWGSSGKTKRFFVFPKKTAEVGRDIDSSSFLSDKERKRLEAQGFDSVSGNGAGWGRGAPEIVVFNPEQIKSADPVTYDDTGNVIPLSQRFQTSSQDIRFMPAGEGLPLSEATAPERQQQVEKPLGMVALPKKPTPVERTMQADAGDFSVVIGGKPGKYGFGYTTIADLTPTLELSQDRKKYLIEALTPRNDELNKKRDALLEVGNLYWENIDIKNKEDKSQDDIQRSEEITDLLNEFMDNPDRDFTLNDAAQVAEVERLTRSINLMNRGMVPAPFKFPVDNREVPVPVEKPADISPDASKEDKAKYAKELAAYEAYVALVKKREEDVSVGLKSLQGAVATLFKTKKFKEFIAEAAGLTGIQFDNILGTWKFEPEPSFVFSAQGMTWEQAQSVTKWLSVLMTQDAGIAWKPSIGLTEGAKSVYLVHDKKLTDEQILNAFKKAKEVGIDGLSVTVDGRGIKAANFDGIEGFDDKLVEIQKSANIKNYHATLVDSFYYDTTSDFTADDGSLKVPDWIKGESINENTQDQQGTINQGFGESGGDIATRGFPILLRRGIDSVLIPYAKSLAGEGFTFDPDRFAERYGLGQEVAYYIREQLYPTTGLSRSVTPILDGTEKFTVPESYYTKGGRLKTSVNDLMYALQKRSADDGFIQPGDYSTRAGQIVAETVVDEIVGHMERAAKNPEAPNAIGWYDTALKKMKQKYSEFFPFLNRGTPTYDADKEFIFDSVLGIASQGNNVFENGKMAARVQFLLESGKTLPEIKDELYGTFGGETRAIENNLLKLDELIKNNGIQALDKLFRKKMTVSEWNEYFKKNKNLWFKGKPLTVDGKSDQMVTGFSVFGPKIGSFINNLHGDYTTLTADLWYTRTWNRILGNVFQHAPLKEANQFNSFRKTILEQYRSDSAQSAGEKFEPLLKRVNKDGEKEFFDYMQEPELDGISRDNLDKLLADPQKMLEFATALEDRYRKGQYKAKSDLRRAAKNWVENRTDPVAAPRTDLERDFQQDVMEIAQKKLRRKGIDITIADMQAALWYNEKELFGLYGAQVSGSEPADYADAADNVDEIMAYASLFKVNRLVEVDGKKRTEIVRLLTPEEEVALTGVQNAKTPEEYVALLAARKKAEDDENAAEKKLEEAELKVAKFERELATATDEKSKQKLQASLEKAKMTLSNLTGGTKETSSDLTGENQE